MRFRIFILLNRYNLFIVTKNNLQFGRDNISIVRDNWIEPTLMAIAS